MVKNKHLQQLKFNKTIVPSVKESISNKDLLARLKDLSNEISSIDAEKIDTASLDNIKDQLGHKKLLKNSNLGIQAYVACCLSDILRIYAPDAPFTASQLTDIFKLFFHQFRHLNEQETNGYFQQYLYLLQRLAEVRSVILITDLPDSEKLIELLFRTFYDLANQNDFPTKLEPLICDILSEVISESDFIPHSVLKLILNKFLSTPSSTQLSNVSNPGLNFTLSICKTNTDRMSRQITQFFSEIIYESSNTIEDGKEAHEVKSKIAEQVQKIHRLTLEIWKTVPEVLSSVMGLIDNELEAEDVHIRVLATETIGKIIAVQPSRINFLKDHSDSLTIWLKKTLDISPQVRCKWVETSVLILNSRSEISILNDIRNGLTKSLLDSDERVRYMACKKISELHPNIFIKKLANLNIMNTLGQLIREKHADIRNKIISLLGYLYNEIFDDLYKGDEALDKLLSWIPDHILSLIYINDKNINSVVDLCIFEQILPIENNTVKRVHRLLTILQSLSPKPKSSFVAIIRRQQQLSDVLLQFINFCELFNGGSNKDADLEKKLQRIIDWLCNSLPDNINSKECLKRFLYLNNRRFYKLVKLCLSVESDYETIRNSLKEFFNKISDAKTIKLDNELNSISLHEMSLVFKLLLYRSSVLFVNKSNVSIILKIAKDTSHSLNKSAQDLLEVISNQTPGVFKSEIHELTNLISNYDNDDSNRESLTNSLKTVYHFIKKFPDFDLVDSSGVYENLSKISLYGMPLEARYAIRILLLSNHKYSYSEEIMSKIYPLDANKQNFVTDLAVIAELFLKTEDNSVVESKASEITTYLIKEILLKNRKLATDNDPEWVDDVDLEKVEHKECYAKLLTLKIFVNRLISISPNSDELDGEEVKKIQVLAEPVLKLLVSLIGNGGEIVSPKSKTYPTPKHYQSRLRLQAGVSLLKLSKYPVYNGMLKTASLNSLIFLIQDENLSIRQRIISKLEKYLNDDLISERFLPLVFFIAHEPNEDLKKDVKTWIKSSFNRKLNSKKNQTAGGCINNNNNIVYERSLVRLLHMVSHHQEFVELIEESFENDPNGETSLQAYSFALEYICFYLEIVGTQENISLLYYFASRLKQYRDNFIPDEVYESFYSTQENADNSTNSQKHICLNIYRIAELCQASIKELSSIKNWIISTYPGKFQLSADLFKPTKSLKEAQYVVSNVFIPEVISKRLNTLIKVKVGTITSHHQNTGSSSGVKRPKQLAQLQAQAAKPNLTKKVKLASRDVDGDKENYNLTNRKSSKKFRKYDANVPAEPTRKSSRSTKKINYNVEDGSESEQDGYEEESE
ncbi:hypothetical protein PACTADRAFT_210 [Pachysolen tannophilus NRRL Y-2460]|uniref:Sister chromatid cohesion protein PDS5 n=1 Tax=Pachysolen tannophilus NRRL Y-2460 TaxID=669874 RepID=A0A1E4U100_PACTA|nr:hypothetical protein PACTADRAFT_210 [Pachysolen tannophilus NRRL Y-2460]